MTQIGFPKEITPKETPYERNKRYLEKSITKGLSQAKAGKGKKLILRHKKATPKKKRVKLPSMRALTTKADTRFSLWIRTRDGFKCVLQNSKCHGAIQNGHLIKRGKRSVRWDELNCHALCSYHNFLDNMEPQHYISWFLREYGELPYQDLVERSRGVFKPSREFLNEIISKYAQKS